MSKKGIDVSAHQGVIDWAKVKNAGIQFAILRAGYGTSSIDKYFKKNADGCKKNKIPFGVYWFMYCKDDASAKKNATACINAIKGLKLDYPVCADFEYDSVSYANKYGVNVTKENASRWVTIFLDTVQSAGYSVCNYTNQDFYNRYFTDAVNKKYDLWLAKYGNANTMTNNAAMWQYSSKGKVNGITGNVDMDEAHKTYPEVKPDPSIHTIPEVYNLVFDPTWYYSTYPDLQNAVRQLIDNKSIANSPSSIAWWLFEHFTTVGMDEADAGRYGCPTFNVKKYKQAYPDLRAALGDSSYKPYYYHYMQAGAAEIASGARAKVDLSV